MKTLHYYLLPALLICLVPFSQANEVSDPDLSEDLLPSIYSNEGSGSPFGAINGLANVSVDPFSGALSVTISEIGFPLNGGGSLGVNFIYRSYDQLGDSGEYSPFGLGWSVHAGYVQIARRGKMCDRRWDAFTMDNPVFVSPSGATSLFAMTSLNVYDQYGMTYGSGDGLSLFCQGEDFYVMTPSGTRYDFEQAQVLEDQPARWYVNKITDRNGNEILIGYAASGFHGVLGKVITDMQAQGLTISFEYSGLSGSEPTLSKIVTPSGSWSFSYQSAGVASQSRYKHLTAINGPANVSWDFDYWSYTASGENGSASLKSITNRFGGRHDFTYDLVQFNPDLWKKTNAISSHSIDYGQGTATWDYDYYPASGSGSGAPASSAYEIDKTVVSGPDGVETYRHVGMHKIASGDIWFGGSRLSYKMNPVSGPVRTEFYQWGKNAISPESHYRIADTGGDLSTAPRDGSFSVPRLLRQEVQIGGSSYSTEYDLFSYTGLPFPSAPQKITESTSSSGFSGSRVVNRYYYNNPDKWIWGQESGFSYDLGNGAVYQLLEFNEEGNVDREYVRGAETHFTYDSKGNIATSASGVKSPVTFGSYKAGVARRVDYPDGGYLVRQVNDLGLVESEENALGEETLNTYDSIGRPKTSVPPVGLPTSYDWSGNSVVVTRGSQSTRMTFDGMGRVVSSQTSGVVGMTVKVESVYDYAGRLRRKTIFHLESGKQHTAHYTRDGYGRVTSMTHPGGSRSYTYSGSRITITDERGNVTVQDFQSFGDVGYESLVYLDQDDAAPMDIIRDDAGQILSVTQGEVVRSYTYYPYYRLESVTEPETGVEKYLWDQSGNVILTIKSDSLESSSYNYWMLNEWDDMNRIVRREDGRQWLENDESTGITTTKTWSESYSYDLASRLISSARNERVSVSSGSGSTLDIDNPAIWTYRYNDNGAVTSAILSVDKNQFELVYDYDDLGYVSSMTYPSGKRIDYAPNVYGWATRLGDYVTGVKYHPTGAIAEMAYANGDVYQSGINDRFMLSGFNVFGTNGAILDKSYAYDPVGNITDILDSLDSGRSQSINYDRANRVTSAAGIWGEETYSYDPAGNLASMDRNGVVSTYHYDSRNRLASVTGRVSRNYEYNDWGAVVKSNNLSLHRTFDNKVFRYTDSVADIDVTMLFDADGRRVRATETGDRRQYFVYDPSGKLVYQFNPDDDWYKEYYYLAGAPRATRKISYECSDDVDQDGIPHCVERSWNANPYDASDAGDDSDADGLTNYQEYQAGTDATRNDTDADGMPDGYEVGAGTNPVLDDAGLDPDNDGYSNLDEYQRGSDPQIGDPPTAPQDVLVMAGHERVLLSWNADESGSWRVYRSLQPIEDISAVPYVDVTEPYYLDTSVSNGVRVHYKVTSVSVFGESLPSEQVSAVADVLQWQTIDASSIDDRGNAYKLSVGAGSISMTVFYADGAPARHYDVYTAPEGKSIQILDKDFGSDGTALVVWRFAYQTSQIWASYFHPKRGWKEPWAIASGDMLSSVSGAIGGDPDSTAVVAYMRRISSTRPDGSVQVGYRAYSAHIDSRTFYWYEDRAIDYGGNIEGVSSSPYISLVASGDDIWAVWEAYYWPDSGLLSDRETAIWVNSFKFSSGNWAQKQPVLRSSGICCDVTLFGSRPVMQQSHDGKAVVSTTSGTAAYTVFDGTSWSDAVPEYLEGRFNHDGSFSRMESDRNGVTSSRNAITDAGLQVISTDVISGRKTSGVRIVPESKFGDTRAFWLDSSGIVHQSLYRDMAWNEEISSSLVPQDSSSLRNDALATDALGNIRVLDNGTRVYFFGPRSQTLYGMFVDVGSHYTSGFEGSDVPLYSEAFSLNGDVVSYSWTQVSGPEVMIHMPSSASTAIRLPSVDSDVAVTVRLTVTDSMGVEAHDDFTIAVLDRGLPPTVSAGDDVSVLVGENVSLVASASDDGNIVSWSWEQLSGENVTLSGASEFTANFVAPMSGNHELAFRVTVADDQGLVSSDDVVVTVNDPDPAPVDEVAPVVTYDFLYPDPDNSKWDKAWLKINEEGVVYFRLSGPVTLVYSWPSSTLYPGWYECSVETCYLTLEFSKRKGTPTIEYFGIDTAGNVSATLAEPMRP